MRSLTIIGIVLAGICEIAVACCHQKTITTCCGKGKCNIFCCNCNHGCIPGCGADIPICWAFSNSQVLCQDTVSRRSMMLAGNLPQLAGSKDEDTIFKAVDAENIPYCRVFDDGKARCSNAVKPPPEEREFHLAIRAGSESDEDMFKAADTNNTGYFTYDQFLVYTNSKNDLPTMLYFNKFDKNGDGVITLNEMRLDDGEGEL